MPPIRTTRAGAKKSPKTSPKTAAKLIINDKPLKSTPGYYPPPGLIEDPKLPNIGTDAMQEDFKGFGFNADKIAVLMAIKEKPVDSCTQTTHGTFAREKEAKNKRLVDFLRKRTRRQTQLANRRADADAIDKKRGRQQIKIKGKNWVLFDASRGFPPMEEAPEAYKRYARYEPGNKKIIAYNLEWCSIALRAIPAFIEGNVVQYPKAGPRLVKIKRERKAS